MSSDSGNFTIAQEKVEGKIQTMEKSEKFSIIWLFVDISWTDREFSFHILEDLIEKNQIYPSKLCVAVK